MSADICKKKYACDCSGHDIFGGINDMMFRIPFVGNWLYMIGLSEYVYVVVRMCVRMLRIPFVGNWFYMIGLGEYTCVVLCMYGYVWPLDLGEYICSCFSPSLSFSV